MTKLPGIGDRGRLGLGRVRGAAAPELAPLEPTVRERDVTLARGEGRDRAHPHHPG